ncbi:helicase associated domain-containing protein [Arthrobacter sp. NPDC097144]|uniref:helicase associated domain-containing protein n=1 Tax=Arthrobacter sp. NPDC097144 TaxID=3363946 RepID=UPI0038115780
MWTKGLDPWRIAVLCRVPYRKVYEHIRNRIAYHPELFGQRLMVHDQPTLPPGGFKKLKPSWEERAAQLADFRQAHGRFPRGYIEGEQQLYTFMQYQRQQYRAGKLPEPRKSFLDEHLPGWLTPPKKEREEALWEQRAQELEKFIAENGRYPRYKTAVEPLEKVLAVWMQRQRDCLRRGTLRQGRRTRLEQQNPNWHRSSC